MLDNGELFSLYEVISKLNDLHDDNSVGNPLHFEVTVLDCTNEVVGTIKQAVEAEGYYSFYPRSER